MTTRINPLAPCGVAGLLVGRYIRGGVVWLFVRPLHAGQTFIRRSGYLPEVITMRVDYDFINKVLEERGISIEEIRKEILHEYGGLIKTDDGIYRAIGQRLGLHSSKFMLPDEVVPLSDMTAGDEAGAVKGIVSGISEEDKGKGNRTRKRIAVVDEKGVGAIVNVYGKDIDKLDGMKIGDVVEMSPITVSNFRGRNYLFLSDDGQIKKVGGGKPSKILVPIEAISLDRGIVTIEGRVTSISEPRNFQRADGEGGSVHSFTLADRTGAVRVTVWDDEPVVEEGKSYQISNLRVSENKQFAGMDLSPTPLTRFQEKKGSKLPDVDELPKLESKRRRVSLAEVKDSKATCEFRAIIRAVSRGTVDKPRSAVVERCAIKDCGRLIINEKWNCDHEGGDKDLVLNFSLTIDDGETVAFASVLGDAGEKLIDMKAEDAMELAKEKMHVGAPLEVLARRVVGEEYVMVGRIGKRGNDIRIYEVMDVDYEQELRHLLAH